MRSRPSSRLRTISFVVTKRFRNEPSSDGSTKKSARGRLAVTRDGYGALRLIEQATPADEAASELQHVWADGEFVRTQTFAEVREVLAAAK